MSNISQANLKINIWSPAGEETLPANEQDVAELLAPHLTHIAGLCEQGFTSGQVLGENFQGWWAISAEE